MPIAAFRIVPYFTRKNIDLPDLEQHIDVLVARLCKLKDMTVADPDYYTLCFLVLSYLVCIIVLYLYSASILY